MGTEPKIEQPRSVDFLDQMQASPEVSKEVAVEQEPVEQEMLTEEEQRDEAEALKLAESLAQEEHAAFVVPKDPVLLDLETALSDGLADIYRELPESKKPVFRAKGEEIAMVVRDMIASGKISVPKILQLIRAWLRLIPGVNKFFLEQEAKIKADKLADYAESKVSEVQTDL